MTWVVHSKRASDFQSGPSKSCSHSSNVLCELGNKKGDKADVEEAVKAAKAAFHPKSAWRIMVSCLVSRSAVPHTGYSATQ
jgi:hypothetical protein